MNYQKFFELAKAKGIDQAQIQVSRSSALSISLFRHEIESYSVNDSQSIIACGVYNGKLGVARTEKLDKDSFEFLVDQIILNATLIEKEEEADLFKGSPKYKKKNVFNPALAEVSAADKLATLRRLEEAIYACDERVSEVEAAFTERQSSSEFYNSFGLKLKQKSNYFYFVGSVVVKQGEEVKTNYDVFLDSDLNKFDLQAFAENIVKKGVAKFGAETIESKKYPTVLAHDIVADLVNSFLNSAIADEVQRHSSFLEGKLGQKVASSKLTIEEKPLTPNVFFTYFDDEGVATQNKAIVKSGVLKQYFYNRETAKKDGVESTGNGTWQGSKIGTGYGNIFVKPGKQTFDELIAPIKEGVFITEIMGLGTGMNETSGDFSCQAEGYMIRDGKVAEPITLITLSGNLLKMFRDLKGFSSEAKMTTSAISCADAYIKSMSIGGK